MNKIVVFLLLFGLFFSGTGAQEIIKKKNPHPAGKRHLVSTGIAIPIGDFNNTYILGVIIEYGRSNFRFGQMNIKPNKKIGYVLNGGLGYYLGKNETISSYSYNYPGYFFLHAFGGIIYNLERNININLTVGPGLGIYNGLFQFNIGSKLEGNYYLNDKIAISAGIIMMKELKTNPLWANYIKASLAF